MYMGTLLSHDKSSKSLFLLELNLFGQEDYPLFLLACIELYMQVKIVDNLPVAFIILIILILIRLLLIIIIIINIIIIVIHSLLLFSF